MVSFELLIPDAKAVEQSFEGQQCNLLNLIRVADLLKESAENPDIQPLLLVPDDIKTSELTRLAEKYGPGTKLISCLWFYFSVCFTFQLPLEPFVLVQSQRRVDKVQRIRELLEACVRSLDSEYGLDGSKLIEEFTERRLQVEEIRKRKKHNKEEKEKAMAEQKIAAESAENQEVEKQDDVPHLGKRERDPNEPLEDGEIAP